MASSNKSNPFGIFVAVVIFFGVIFFLFKNEDSSSKGFTESYTLPLGDDFNLGLAARDDLGISVVIAVDVSGSMSEAPQTGGQAKYILAAKALSQVMSVLDRVTKDSSDGQIVKVGLLKFSSTAEVVLPLTVLTKINLKQIKALVSNPNTWEPTGSTAIGDALVEGTRMLTQSGTVLRSFILVTDGENTEGENPETVLAAIYANRNDKSTPDFPVFTSSNLMSFIGFDLASGTFDPLKKYGARVTSASNESELAQNLSDLLEADITKLEAPELGNTHGK